MVYIRSVSDVKKEVEIIKRDIGEAKTPMALNILSKRAKNLVRDANQPGLKNNIRRAARNQYRGISNQIRKKRKRLR